MEKEIVCLKPSMVNAKTLIQEFRWDGSALIDFLFAGTAYQRKIL